MEMTTSFGARSCGPASALVRNAMKLNHNPLSSLPRKRESTGSWLDASLTQRPAACAGVTIWKRFNFIASCSRLRTSFDAFTPRSHHGDTAVSPETQRNRHLLLGLISAAGWDFYKDEWWHYQLFDARRYPLISDRAVPASNDVRMAGATLDIAGRLAGAQRGGDPSPGFPRRNQHFDLDRRIARGRLAPPVTFD